MNDAPTIPATISRSVFENTATVGFIGGSDVDSGETLTWSITGGVDQALFSIDPSDGFLSFIGAPDFETPLDDGGDNFYDVEVSLTDGDETVTSDVTVEVRNLQETPIISINNVSANEGNAGLTTLTFTIALSEISASDVTFNAVLTNVDTDAADFAPGQIGVLQPLQIAAGNLTTTFDVNVQGDTLAETSETFNVTLQDIVGAIEGDVIGLGVIVNDDGGNNPPVANDDVATTDEDTPVDGNVLANDNDPNPGDVLTARVLTGVSDGTLDFNETTGAFTYTPDANFNGSDSFTYEADDGNGGTSTATVTITINPVNDAPVALDDTATTDEDVAVTVDVLANDSDVDGPSLTIDSIDSVVGGTANIVGGQIEFTPTANFNGTARVNYTATDGTLTDQAELVITVNPVNDAPLVVPVSGTFSEDDSPIDVNLLAGASDIEGDDLDTANVGVTSDQGRTVLFTVNNETGVISITPGQFEDLAATDSEELTVTYDVTDGDLSTPNTATITINGENDAPVGVDDTAQTDEDTVVTIDAVANDTDVDGDTLSIDSIDSVTGGTANIVGGQIEFTPTANFNGTAFVTYTVTDGTATDQAQVEITVNPVNDAPIVGAVAQTFSEDANPIDVDLLAGSSDIEGDDLDTANVMVTSDQGRTVLFTVNNETGVISITPGQFEDLGATDTEELTVTYDITDGDLSTPNTATITINGENDNPVAVDDMATTDANTAVLVDVLSNDTDVDGDVLSIDTIDNVTGGSAIISGGQIQFTPTNGFSGVAEVDYTVTDGNGGTSSATAFIDVGEIPNRAPVADDDAVETDEDTPISFNLLDNDSDPDGDPIELNEVRDADGSIIAFDVETDLVNGGTVVISRDGTVLFDPAGDYEALGFNPQPEPPADSFQLTYNVIENTDDALVSSDALATISIRGVNDAPVLDPAGPFSIVENTTAIGTLTASDIDSANLTFSISGGADGAQFDITNGGELSFLSAPDFEAPADLGGTPGDNMYEVEVTVSDGILEDTQLVTVEVTNDPSDDVPVLPIIEGTDGFDYLVGTGADEIIRTNGGPIDFALGGGGADVFEFNEELSNGMFETDYIIDFTDDDTLELNGAAINFVSIVGGSTYIFAGPDNDQIILFNHEATDLLGAI